MAFRTLRIDEVDPIEVAGVRWHPLRHALGVRGFGVNAYSGAAGQDVIEEHTESDEDGTTVLALGGAPGVPFEVSAWEWRFRAQPHIDAEEWETGVALMHDGLAARPGDASLLYNLACFEARLGRLDDAAGHLQQAFESRPDDVRGWAAGDSDLDPLRDRPDFPR
jgi:hypothetical protein